MSLPVPQRCIACGQPQDYFGEHALCCKAMGVYARHNALRQTLADLVSCAGFACQLEVALPGSNLVPACPERPRAGGCGGLRPGGRGSGAGPRSLLLNGIALTLN